MVVVGTDKPCEICGNIGFVDALRICSKCKVTREHLYCMREIPEEDPGKWVCDVCHSNNQKPSSMFLQSKQPSGTRIGISLNRPPKKSKVQFIEPEEAKNLVSGSFRNSSSSPSKHCSNKSPMKKPFFSKTNSFTSPNLSTKPNSWRESQYNSNMWKRSKDDSWRTTTDGSGRGRCEESVPKKRVTFGILPKPGASSDVHVQKSCLETPTAKQLPVGKLSRDAINSGHRSKLDESLPTISSGGDCCAEPRPNNVDPKGTESPNITMVLELDRYLPNHPATQPTWKGTFEINHFGSIDSIQAHPPCKVHKNVLTFSKKLPESLQFEMLPRQNYWAELFENDVPSELDIGLYFLSSPKHEQGYFSLVMHLDEHDLLLRSAIDEIELFVFSSKHLPEDSHELNQRHFLWGLCRKCKKMVSIEEENVSQDMEVDMVGGQEVGSVDVVVLKSKTESKAREEVPDFSSIQVKEEVIDGTEKACLQLEREIQESFDRLAKMLRPNEGL